MRDGASCLHPKALGPAPLRPGVRAMRYHMLATTLIASLLLWVPACTSHKARKRPGPEYVPIEVTNAQQRFNLLRRDMTDLEILVVLALPKEAFWEIVRSGDDHDKTSATGYCMSNGYAVLIKRERVTSPGNGRLFSVRVGESVWKARWDDNQPP